MAFFTPMQVGHSSFMCVLKKSGSFFQNLGPNSIQTTHYLVEREEKKLKVLKKDKEQNHGCLDRINC